MFILDLYLYTSHFAISQANQTNKPAFSRVQSMSYQFVADSHSSHRRSLETEVIIDYTGDFVLLPLVLE